MTKLFFQRRVFMCAALAYAGGIALFVESEGSWVILLVAALLIVAASFFLFRKAAAIIVFTLIYAAGAAYAGVKSDRVVEMDERNLEVIARVVRVLDRDTIIVGGITANGRPVQGRAVVNVYTGAQALPGQTVRMENAYFYTPSAQTRPYGFDPRMYVLSNGANLAANVTQVEVTGMQSLIFGNAQLLRNKICEKIDILFGVNAGIIKALTVGVADDLDEGTLEDFRKIGAAHILAISGLQATIVAAVILWLMRRLPIGFVAQRFVSAIALFAYCMLAGMAPSVVRAVVMAVFLFAGQIAHRDRDALTSLAVVALVMLAFNPMTLYSVGFQLSFMAVAGMALLTAPLTKAIKCGNDKVMGAAVTTIAAQLGVLPFLLLYFGEISLISILANVVLVPLSTLTVIVALPVCVASLVLPVSAAGAAAAPAYVLASFLRFFVKGYASIPYMTISMHAPGIVAFLCYYAALIWRSESGKLNALVRTAALFIALTAFLLKPTLNTPRDFTLTCYDVGYGNAALVQYRGQSVLIDCGQESTRLYHTLRAQGIRIDTLVLTHGHDDHGGGLKNIVDYVKVDNIVLWHGADFDSYSASILSGLSRAVEKGISITLVGAGESFMSGEIALDVLSPAFEGRNENENSLVLLARPQDREQDAGVLFAGDAGAMSELYISAEASVLMVGHHGSRSSTSAAFLQQVQPKLALISVGRNVFGHPSPEVADRLLESGATVYTTLNDGTIMISFGNGHRVRTYRGRWRREL